MCQPSNSPVFCVTWQTFSTTVGATLAWRSLQTNAWLFAAIDHHHCCQISWTFVTNRHVAQKKTNAFIALTQLVGRQKQYPAGKKLSDEVMAWLSVWRELNMICICSSWCYCQPIISCFIKIQIGLTFLVLAYRGWSSSLQYPVHHEVLRGCRTAGRGGFSIQGETVLWRWRTSASGPEDCSRWPERQRWNFVCRVPLLFSARPHLHVLQNGYRLGQRDSPSACRHAGNTLCPRKNGPLSMFKNLQN